MNYTADRALYNDSSKTPNQFYISDPIENYSNSKNIPKYASQPLDDSRYANSSFPSNYFLSKEAPVTSLRDLSKSTYSVFAQLPKQ